jgi:hypothetical protein
MQWLVRYARMVNQFQFKQKQRQQQQQQQQQGGLVGAADLEQQPGAIVGEVGAPPAACEQEEDEQATILGALGAEAMAALLQRRFEGRASETHRRWNWRVRELDLYDTDMMQWFYAQKLPKVRTLL